MITDDFDGPLLKGPTFVHRASEWAEELPSLGNVEEYPELRSQSARYAAAVALASNASSRIAVLATALEDTEYFRSLAENQLEVLQDQMFADFRLVTVTSSEFPEEAAVVFGLQGQRFYIRNTDLRGWLRIGVDGNPTYHSGPRLEDGPFVWFESRTDIAKTANNLLSQYEARKKLANAAGLGNAYGGSKTLLEVADEAIKALTNKTDVYRETAADKETALWVLEKEVRKTTEAFGVSTLEELNDLAKPAVAAAQAEKPPVGAPHVLVRQAEQMILQGAEVLDNGDDPTYDPELLKQAAAILLAAAELSTC